ncbi:MAG: 23S rRNA (adenine(2503)-C(2))-methyltransferase RlmN [Rhodobiaceae bacterium]|nr:23S rRNA (adenine(2503)-C(2))-methyltransferase RlmN [Rhodobiaceae bacterium]MCB2009973.1 23S rRNA (adenine(2503)-C(2))-methyltransferase RlmN [Geminicoccaceae bacterium]
MSTVADIARPAKPALAASQENSGAAPSLAGAGRAEIARALGDLGVPENQRRMRVAQLWQWIYGRGATGFDDMSNVGKELRGALGDHFSLARPQIVSAQLSADGTRKWLLRSQPGTSAPAEFECVYIPEEDRGTLCISSQVGCSLTCSFCHTGTQRLLRNLTAAEVAGQILVARDALGEWPGAERPTDGALPLAPRAITNIVLMGMGEPLHNFDNVRDAMATASDNEGLGYSKRRITLSTSGVVPQIARWGAEAGTMLAISLHAVRDELRDELVPINRKHPIRDLLAACRAYPGVSNARRITFEYVMLDGINDSDADARELVRLMAGIPAKINLIPFNPWPGTAYDCSPWDRIEAFAEIINRAGYSSPVRSPRGRDIMAACGQLKSASERQASEVKASKAGAKSS